MAVVDAPGPRHAFAEELGRWVHFADAITLSAVHNEGGAERKATMQEVQCERCAAAASEFGRVRSALVNSITKSCSPNSGKTHIKLPAAELSLPVDLQASYAPYGRFYSAHQREMDLAVQPLRLHVRRALAQATPALKKLADLDATLDKILRDRESKLLSKVSALLKKRFEHLFMSHQKQLVEAQQADNPAGWMQAGGWLRRFCDDMQMLLLAELEFRLQPTLGLIEASDNKIRNE